VLQLVKTPSGAPAPGALGGGAASPAPAANGAPAAAGGDAAGGGGAAAGAGRQPREWGEFLHAPGKIFTDFERIRWLMRRAPEPSAGTAAERLEGAVCPCAVWWEGARPRVPTALARGRPSSTHAPSDIPCPPSDIPCPLSTPPARQEIQSETDRVSGANKNVSDKPIRLKICSPHVL
jgi:hypothetical protein